MWLGWGRGINTVVVIIRSLADTPMERNLFNLATEADSVKPEFVSIITTCLGSALLCILPRPLLSLILLCLMPFLALNHANHSAHLLLVCRVPFPFFSEPFSGHEVGVLPELTESAFAFLLVLGLKLAQFGPLPVGIVV